MLQSLLNYISEPLYFGVFTVAIGLAYVIVWLLSLRELGGVPRGTYFRAVSEDNGPRLRQANASRNGYSRNAGKVVAVPRKNVQAASGRKAGVTRPTPYAA